MRFTYYFPVKPGEKYHIKEKTKQDLNRCIFQKQKKDKHYSVKRLICQIKTGINMQSSEKTS